MKTSGKSRVTLSDIAERVGVSVSTVSQALAGKGRISQATRERILQTVEELSYQPDQAAQSLALRRASQLSDTGRPKAKRRKARRMPSHALVNLMDTAELKQLVQMEIQQKKEEGYEVEASQEAFAAREKWTKRQLYGFYHDLATVPRCADYPYQEPEVLGQIQEARPEGPRAHTLVVTPGSLYDRIYGAWLGRCAGCVLGKPIEAGWSKGKVIQYLKMANAYPLSNYIPRVVPLPPSFELNPESDGFFLGEIDGVPYDDDVDYTVLGLHILESHGLSFSTSDVATEWLGHLPYFRVYTAERIAYRNLTLNISPPETAVVLNPARELIGARIRADVYGYIAPGKPELAAALAYRDATLSHTKNGVYSAMFMAAMIAWAFVTADLREIVEVGLSEIPRRCRLAEAVREVLDVWAETADWEIAYDRLILKYGSYHPVHAIVNTLWVVLALLYSDGDFEKAICTAVTCGLDTDCNGANVGSVMGVLLGEGSIADKWTAPLQDTVYTTIAQWKERRISALARRTAEIAEQTLSSLG
jgi:ADP-ribosylglycohydrolase/transcriptional regulator with XRE-family HTH domain